MTDHTERLLVRILIGAALCIALLAAALAPVPEDGAGHPALPALALGQVGLYRLEVALLVFYGSLLLVTPAFSGLIRGRLPTEISARGAKFAEDAEQSAELAEAAGKELERSVSALAEKLNKVMIELDQMRGEVTVRDGD